MSLSKQRAPIQSTAGAIPIQNEKGQITMEKVKVARYVSGKRPEYAPDTSDEEEDLDIHMGSKKPTVVSSMPVIQTEAEHEDRRLKRLQERSRGDDSDNDDRIRRHHQLHEPEVLATLSDTEEHIRPVRTEQISEESSSEEEEELEEEEIERRRALLRERARQKREEEEKELLDVEEEEKEGSDDDSSEWEEYTDSEEDEEAEPRLKPVFVRRKDRITIQEKEREEQKQRQLEEEAKDLVIQRRKQTLIMVEDQIRKEMEQEKEAQDTFYDAVNTDDENDEEEYEAWKLREMRRTKREREEREVLEKEKIEADRLRNMTEEERREELKRNPKLIVNKAAKGKYKYLQKYYHRGAFFLDKEENVFTRDFAAPTLEDHFNKSVLPKVMQVKNFGRSGRTKYTHLVDQDTTHFESPWMSDTTMNLKFHMGKGGGMKQTFDRPSTQKHK